MRLSWNNSQGKHPFAYARRILKECGLREPPICENTVADYLRLGIREFPLDGDPLSSQDREILEHASAWLQRRPDGNSRIWVHRDTHIGRKRLSIFHECGHYILPWHREVDYFCDEHDVHPTIQKDIEREAFKCGAEFLMPGEAFVEDVLSLEIGMSAIKQLSGRYMASLEATAIRYASTHPGICAIAMVVAAGSQRPKVTTEIHGATRQLALPMAVSDSHNIVESDGGSPLRVKYFAGSQTLVRESRKYIRAGTCIYEGNLVFQAWLSGRPVSGEIPASVFGSSSKWSYKAECLPVGKSGMVLVLLWRPHVQCELLLGGGLRT